MRRENVRQGFRAVNSGFPCAEQIEVGTIDKENATSHGGLG